jgi:hypothetical protein
LSYRLGLGEVGEEAQAPPVLVRVEPPPRQVHAQSVPRPRAASQ